ncbi:MarR family winged helix-turn-helix transcriptional regulator [Salimicrobium halophilum]|uniref:DNA-binding transcriptional regulator, MarR family n=1 Tax=Salimicrobium halophilum TaxID=86666 RepID=A0A1G8T1A3_9BACI|nr:winged helix DNA-binding protein [Salimicrobium halophilum]SDJ35227.1 DNA-binding transcriptional regulator, MarR family [Salimicrobium halophilum]
MNERTVKQVYESIYDIYLHGSEHVARSLKEDKELQYFSREQTQLIKVIDTYPRTTLKEIAEILGVHKTGISNKVKKLVEGGYLEYRQGPDQKSKYVEVTEKGHEVVTKIERINVTRWRELFDDLFTNEEMKELDEKLQRIRTRFEEEEDIK